MAPSGPPLSVNLRHNFAPPLISYDNFRTSLQRGRVASEAHELVGEKEVGGEDSAEEEDDGNIILSDSDVSDDPYIYNVTTNARKVALVWANEFSVYST